MAVDRGETGTVRFYNDQGKRGTLTFRLKPDGKIRWYNLDVLKSKDWRGTICLMEILPSDDPDAKTTVKSVAVSETLKGPAEVVVEQARQTEAINRVGTPSTFAVRLRNDGGKTARNVAITAPRLPPGRTVEIESIRPAK